MTSRRGPSAPMLLNLIDYCDADDIATAGALDKIRQFIAGNASTKLDQCPEPALTAATNRFPTSMNSKPRSMCQDDWTRIRESTSWCWIRTLKSNSPMCSTISQATLSISSAMTWSLSGNPMRVQRLLEWGRRHAGNEFQARQLPSKDQRRRLG